MVELEKCIQSYADALKAVEQLNIQESAIRQSEKSVRKEAVYQERNVSYRITEDLIPLINGLSTNVKYDRLVGISENGVMCVGKEGEQRSDIYKLYWT
jgi:predicted Holliday junction resolvase-like endonuclease